MSKAYAYFDSRPCGSGKSHAEITDIVSNPGLYVYAVEKKEMQPDVEAMIHRLAAEAGTKVTVVRIFGRGLIPEITAEGAWVRTGSHNVKTDIEALPGTYVRGHVVALVTHEGLKMADLSGFADWSLCIDETPSIMDKQTIKIALASMADFFAANYDLRALTPTSCEIVIKDGSVAETTKTLARDDLARVVSVFHARVLSKRTTVTTSLTDWADVIREGALEWSSIWSPEQLPVFKRVHVLANDFQHSVTCQIFREKWPEIEWVSLDRPTTRLYARRDVVIRYYAERHEASRSLFTRERGQRHLRMIAVDVAKRVDPTDHIWMCNSADGYLFNHPNPDEGSLVPGIKLSPRQQGSNRYAKITTATMLYTAKPDLRDRVIMSEMGLDTQSIIDAREREPMVQFATRLSVRDADSAEAVILYVYDRAQAAHLARYFDRTGYCRTSLELIDLGFADYVHESTPGRPKVVLTDAEAQARDEKRKEQARLRKQRQRKREAEDA